MQSKYNSYTMLILAIDTSDRCCSAAIVECTAPQNTTINLHDNVISKIYYKNDPENNMQAERLVPIIQTLLKDAACNYHDLSHITTNIGPGSYTGIRISLSVVYGLYIATTYTKNRTSSSINHQNKGTDLNMRTPQLISVDKFEALAYQFICSQKSANTPFYHIIHPQHNIKSLHIVVIIPANHQEVYLSTFYLMQNKTLHRNLKPSVVQKHNIHKVLTNTHNNNEDNFILYDSNIDQTTIDNTPFQYQIQPQSNAKTVALAAIHKNHAAKSNKVNNINTDNGYQYSHNMLKPLYIKKPSC